MPNIRRLPTMRVPVKPRAGLQTASSATVRTGGVVATGSAVVAIRIALAVVDSVAVLVVVDLAGALVAADSDADDEPRARRL